MSRQSVTSARVLNFTPPTETSGLFGRTPHDPVAAAAAADFQQLIRIGPSQPDWQTELEAETARLSGLPHVVATASANVALHRTLATIDLRPDDEIIIPAYLPPSIPEVIRQFDAHPVLVDIEAESAHADLQQISQAMTDRTRAVVAVDIAGLPVETGPLADLCCRNSVLFINDALAQMPRVRDPEGSRLVRLYHCRSEESSLLNAGALICTSDESLALRLRQAIAPLHELDDDIQRWDATRSLHYADRMTDLAAVWQLAALGKSRDAWRRRCQIAMNYTAAFGGRREFQVPFERPDASHSWLEYPLRLNLQHLGLTRDEFTSELRRRGIAVTVSCLPVNLMPAYQQRYGFSAETFPVARNEFLRRVCLPISGAMTDADTDRVVDTIMSFTDDLQHRRFLSISSR